MKIMLLLILGVATISTEIAFRIHNYRVERWMEQEDFRYD